MKQEAEEKATRTLELLIGELRMMDRRDMSGAGDGDRIVLIHSAIDLLERVQERKLEAEHLNFAFWNLWGSAGHEQGDLRDSHHSFRELYVHRNLLWINFCLQNAKLCTWKPDPNGYTWPILTMQTPTGQMSYHVPPEMQCLFEHVIEQKDIGYDGHVSDDVAQRLVDTAVARRDQLLKEQRFEAMVEKEEARLRHLADVMRRAGVAYSGDHAAAVRDYERGLAHTKTCCMVVPTDFDGGQRDCGAGASFPYGDDFVCHEHAWDFLGDIETMEPNLYFALLEDTAISDDTEEEHAKLKACTPEWFVAYAKAWGIKEYP